MLVEKKIAFDLPGGKPFFSDLRKKIKQTCRRWGLDKEDSLHIQIAVDEACTNIVRHAYQNKAGKIRIELQPYNKKIKVVIKDWGNPFQNGYKPELKPDQIIQTGKEGGLGVFTITKLMDEIKYRRYKKHNTLVLIKLRKI